MQSPSHTLFTLIPGDTSATRRHAALRGPWARWIALAATLSACSSDPATPDASATVDAAVDASTADLGAQDVPAAPDVVDASTRDAGATDVPATDVPSTDAPVTDVPATDTGAVDAGATDAPAGDAATTLPANLVVPAGQSELARVSARGVQIYTCTAPAADAGADAGTGYSWVFRAPEAGLYDSASNLFGAHFAGPNWRAVDGSQITGVVDQRANSPLAGAIPWLLLHVSATTGSGVLSTAAFVQRIDTVGGAAPATGCDASTVGTDTRVNYTATYVFWAPTADAAAPAAPLPTVLALPETGFSVLLRAAAQGNQIYRCDAVAPDGGVADGGASDAAVDAGSSYQWTFVAPAATLYDSAMTMIGMHSAGPTWQTTDGSQAVGSVVTRANAPSATAIQWLLLRATSNMGTGILGRTHYIHRVATTGGVAPASGCSAGTVGTTQNVPYTADYYFWGTP